MTKTKLHLPPDSEAELPSLYLLRTFHITVNATGSALSTVLVHGGPPSRLARTCFNTTEPTDQTVHIGAYRYRYWLTFTVHYAVVSHVTSARPPVHSCVHCDFQLDNNSSHKNAQVIGRPACCSWAAPAPDRQLRHASPVHGRGGGVAWRYWTLAYTPHPLLHPFQRPPGHVRASAPTFFQRRLTERRTPVFAVRSTQTGWIGTGKWL